MNEFQLGDNILDSFVAKFNGCNSAVFELYLKECEWRYNYRHKNLLVLVKKSYREDLCVYRKSAIYEIIR